MPENDNQGLLAHPLLNPSHTGRLILAVVVTSIVLGVGSGYFLANKANNKQASPISEQTAKLPQQDSKTFRDFEEGVIKLKPAPKDPNQYTEGTHYLERDDGSPVALTSSVVDLTQYEGKKVKVFGETQTALKEGWLMDVGKIEEIN